MLRRLILVTLALAAWAGADARALSLGANRQAVVQEMGAPSSQAARGNTEILTYPKGIRIVLVDGRVERAEGIELTVLPDSLIAPAEPAETAEPTAAGTQPSAESRQDEPDDDGEAETTASSPAPAEAPSNRAPPTRAFEEEAEETSRLTPLVATLLVLAIHLGVTLLGLKIAFKYWEMDAFFSGRLAIATIDLLLHATLEALGPATGGITSMSAVENGVPGFVMIFTIRHFCFNKDLGDAIQTAAVVKVAVIIIKAAATMTVLSAFF